MIKDAREYFIKMFPESAEKIWKWTLPQAVANRAKVPGAVVTAIRLMEDAYKEHEAFMTEQHKKHGFACMTAELEHIRDAKLGVDAYDKLTAEVVRDVLRKEISL